jgi:hypothetical protein
MNPFTDTAMNRPLFEEPGPHIERTDPFTGPKGFLIGDQAGMGGSPDNLSLAQDFMEAAYVLTEAIKRGDWEDHRLAQPLMFLYRHSLELFLKGVTDSDRKHHDLIGLADDFAAFIRQEYQREVPSWVIKRIQEIGEIDPASTAFRYGRTCDKVTKEDYPVPGEAYVSLPHLQDAMVALNWALASVIGGVITDRMEGLALRHAQCHYLRDRYRLDEAK